MSDPNAPRRTMFRGLDGQVSGYPPSPATHHDLVLEGIKFALSGLRTKDLFYISGPITTGPAYVEQIIHTGKTDAGDIMCTNLAGLFQAEADLSLKNALAWQGYVINPARLVRMYGWSEEAYMKLWCKVLSDLRPRVAMAPGWQMSDGALEEYALARSLGLEVEMISRRHSWAHVRSVLGVAAYRADGEDLDRIKDIQRWVEVVVAAEELKS